MKEIVNKVEPLKYQEWGKVLVDLYRQSVDKKNFMKAMRFGGININGVNITPINFFSTAKDLSNEEVLEAIEWYLEVDNIEENIEKLNHALEYSKRYQEEYLLMKFPREIQNLQIKNINDVLKIFRKTSTLKSRERLGLAPAYCSLVKKMVGNFMFDQYDLQYLIEETKYLYNNIFSEWNGQRSLHIIRRGTDGGYDQIIGVALDGSTIMNNVVQSAQGESYYRGKNRWSFVTKFLVKPEATVQEAIKDGLGLKVEANTKQDISLFLQLFLRELFLKFRFQKVNIENTHLLSEKNLSDLKFVATELIKELISQNQLDSGTINGEDVIKFTNNNNPHSDANFKAIKICEGEVLVPKSGGKDTINVSRGFEVQFVLSANSNEDGFSSHHIYEAKKKLAVVTRDLGSFTEEYLDTICLEARHNSGMAMESIKEHFLNTILAKITPKGGGKKMIRYVVKKRVLELMKTEMFYNNINLIDI